MRSLVEYTLVNVGLLGRCFTGTFRKPFRNGQEREWPKRTCGATQFCVA